MIRALLDRLAPSRPTNAEEWLARAKSRHFTPTARRELETWLALDPQHRKDYECCIRVSNVGTALKTHPDVVKRLAAYAALQHGLASPSEAADIEASRSNGRGGNSQWFGTRVGLAAMATITVIGLALLLVPRLSVEEFPTVVATRLGELRELPLEDGTRVHLNTDSAIQVAYSDRERRVRLAKGEGFFDVIRDPAGRPFVVEVGITEVRVLGTRFSVRATDAGADVIVSEGKVEVVPDTRRESPSIPAKVELVPGNALHFNRLESQVRISAIDPERATAWRVGTITFDNATVEEVIAEVNRYVRTPFVITDDRIRGIQLSGSFKVGDVESVRFALKDFGVESLAEDSRIVLR